MPPSEVSEYTTIEVSFAETSDIAIIKFPQGSPREARFSFAKRHDDGTSEPIHDVSYSLLNGAYQAFVDRYADQLE